MSGNCATGMRNSDRTPASVTRMAMTIASRGRSTKTAEIMPLSARRFRRGRCRGGGTGHHLDARPHPLEAFEHDHVALVQPGHDHRCGWRRLAKLDATLLDTILAIDQIDIIALLVRQNGGARDAECFHRLNAFDQHSDE